MGTFVAFDSESSEDISVEITVGELKLLTSGSVFSTNSESVEFKIDDIHLKFEFKNDDSIKKANIKTSIDDSNKEMTIVLVNFSNPLGEGIIKPFNFMYTDKFDLHLSFYIYTLNEKKGNRKISYNIFYGEKK